MPLRNRKSPCDIFGIEDVRFQYCWSKIGGAFVYIFDKPGPATLVNQFSFGGNNCDVVQLHFHLPSQRHITTKLFWSRCHGRAQAWLLHGARALSVIGRLPFANQMGYIEQDPTLCLTSARAPFVSFHSPLPNLTAESWKVLRMCGIETWTRGDLYF